MIHRIGRFIFGALGMVILMFLPEHNLEILLLTLSLPNLVNNTIYRIPILIPLIITINYVLSASYTILVINSITSILFSYVYELFFLGGIRIKNRNYMFSRRYYLIENSISEIALIIFLAGLLFYLIIVYNSFPVLKWKVKKLYKKQHSVKVCYHNNSIQCVQGTITDIGREYICIEDQCFKDYQLINYKIYSED